MSGAAVNGKRVPDWMAELGIEEGEWQHASKRALEVGMRPTFEVKTRVWCCGMMAAHGYQGECAMKMVRGQRLPVTPADIAVRLHQVALEFYRLNRVELNDDQKKQLRITKQNVRRALAELEGEGVGERRTADGTPIRELTDDQRKRLPSSNLRLYFWVVPREAPVPPSPPKVVKNDYLSSPDLRPLPQFFKHLKLDLTVEQVANSDYLRSVVRGAYEDYLAAEKVAAETARQRLLVALQSPPIEINSEMNELKLTSSSVSRQAGTPEPTVEADPTACLPAVPPIPVNGGTPNLIDLRKLFPKDFIPDSALAKLDERIAARIGDYDRGEFRDFVWNRLKRANSEYRPGLVFDEEHGLWLDFVNKAKDEAAERKAAAEETARRQQEAAESHERAEIARVHEVLANPLSSPDELAEARAHPAAASYFPDPERSREFFDRTVRAAIDGLKRPCDQEWRDRYNAILARAAEIDPERATELRQLRPHMGSRP